MQAFFRVVISEDIPHIKKIVSEIGDEQDYVLKFIEQWLVEGDTLQIGVFSSPQMKSNEIVGFGQLRIFPNGLHWLEAGRISPQEQQHGLGTQLAEYLVNYAFSHGAKFVQYNAWATRDFMGDASKDQTHGSIRIAKRLEFRVKNYVDVLSAKGSELQMNIEHDSANLREKIALISSSEVYGSLKHVLTSLPTEICHGWGYFLPCTPEIINNIGNYVTWIIYGKAIAQFIHYDQELARESPVENEIWIVLYGNPLDAFELLKQRLASYWNYKHFENITIFCPPNVSDALIPLGFHYYGDVPSGAVLFEKECCKSD